MQKHHLKLIIYVLILVVISSITAYYIKANIDKENYRTVETNLLLIQAKVNSIKINSQIAKDDNILIGKNVADMQEENFIRKLIYKNILTYEECDKYYVLDEKTLEENGLNDAKIKNNEYILVNYENVEVILSNPYIYNNKEYYKLSEIKQIEIDN